MNEKDLLKDPNIEFLAAQQKLKEEYFTATESKQLFAEISDRGVMPDVIDPETEKQWREAEAYMEVCPLKNRHTFDDPEVAEDGCPECGWGAK